METMTAMLQVEVSTFSKVTNGFLCLDSLTTSTNKTSPAKTLPDLAPMLPPVVEAEEDLEVEALVEANGAEEETIISW